jgi:hypothetical protein
MGILHKDCFAYSNWKCRALVCIDCACCSFYKTKKQFKEDMQAAKKTLDEHLGFPASKMYYGELLELLTKEGGK